MPAGFPAVWLMPARPTKNEDTGMDGLREIRRSGGSQVGLAPVPRTPIGRGQGAPRPASPQRFSATVQARELTSVAAKATDPSTSGTDSVTRSSTDP